MTSHSRELQAFADRIEKLEKQNRRLKRCGIMLFVVIATVVLMGQTMPSPRVIEAEKFVLKDASGNVRGWMGVLGKGAEITLGNVDAQPMMQLMVSTDSSDLHFRGSRKSGMNLGVNSGAPELSMMAADRNGRAEFAFAKGGPSLTVEDGEGYSTVLGRSRLETQADREADRTSAASVKLFDNNKKVIWQAPSQRHD